MYQRSQISEGMVVRSLDGEKLGKVFAVGDDSFQIEKGLFFPKDYLVRFGEISDIRNGEIILTHGRESLQRLGIEGRYETATTSTSSAATGRDTTGMPIGTPVSTAPGASADISVPLHKEEVDVLKREKQAGEVRVHKDVVEEEKVMEVPVRRERVRVERREVTDRPATGASFQEETVVVPLRAEEVEVQKRAMVDEEVVIHKDALEEERRVAETVRREKVDIRSEGDVEGPRKLNLSGEEEDPTKKRS